MDTIAYSVYLLPVILTEVLSLNFFKSLKMHDLTGRFMYKVLLIDSDPDTRGILNKALGKVHVAEFVILETAVRNAMDALSDNPPDLLMIGADYEADKAFGLIREVRLNQHLNGLTVIFLLPELSEISLKEKAFDAGADLLVNKPVGLPELASVLKIIQKNHAPGKTPGIITGIQASDSDFRSFFEHAADAIFIADAETHCILDANHAAARLMNMPVDKLIGLNQTELHPVYESGSSKTAFSDTVESEGRSAPSPMVLQHIQRSDGCLVPVEIHASLVTYKGRKCLAGTFRDITERVKTAEELELSRKEFRTYFESAAVGMTVTSLDKVWLEVNDRFCQMLGYTREELKGILWTEITHPDDLPNNEELYVKALQGEIDTYEIDKRFFRKDGSLLYVTLSVVCLRNDEGVASHFLSSYVDISQRKIAEEDLIRTRNRYLSIIEKAPDGVVLIDAAGNFSYVSPSAKRIFGYGNEESIQGNPAEYTHPDDIDFVIAELLKVMADASYSPTIQYRFSGKGGIWKYIESTFSNHLDNPDLQSIVINFRDITERKHSEKQIRQERIMLRTLIDNLPDPIYILDNKGRKVVANKADVENIGCVNEANVLGKNDLELFPGEIGERGHADNMQVIQSGNPIVSRVENFIDKQGKQRWLLTSKFPLFDASGASAGLVGIGYDITEQKKIEDDLKLSEEKYRYLFQNNPMVMWIYDVETLKFLEVNEAAMHQYGYTREEFLSMSIRDIRPQDELGRLEQLISNPMEVLTFLQDWKHIKKNGQLIFVEIASHLIDYEGREARLVLVNDITSRKRAQEEIVKSKETYKAFFEDDLTGDFICSAEGQILECNPAFVRIFGFDSQEQALATGLSVLLSDGYSLSDVVEMVNQQSRLTDFEFGAFRLDGKPIFLIANLIGYFDNSGRLETIKGYLFDNTRRKLAELELQKLSRAVEQNPASIVITDVNGNIEYVNPKFSQLTGYSLEEVIGKNPRILKSGFTPQEDYTNLWATILSGREWQGELQNRKKNGEIYYESALISPICDEKGNIQHFLAVKEDITSKNQLMEDLIAAKEKAEESDRLKSAFLANMSHEIRTPMNGILGFMGILQEPGLSGDERDEYIRIVKMSGARLMSTINDIIDISKIESGVSTVNLSETDVNEVMKQSLKFFTPEAEEKQLTLQISEILPEGMSRVLTDSYKLDSVLTNLIKNSLKFTRKGSIVYGCHLEKDMIRFTVTDTGVGIPPDRKSTIFERFVQAETSLSRPFEGSGLGLAISKAYVEMLGGEISVSSELGKGSEFSFTIAYSPVNNTLLQPEAIPLSGEVKALKADHIFLAAEDDDISFLFLKKILANENIRLLRAHDGQEAIRMCKEIPEICFVLMDIKMPKVDGYEATRSILGFRPDLPVVALTAYAFPEDHEKAMACGCVDYLTKPLNRDKLFRIIGKHLPA